MRTKNKEWFEKIKKREVKLAQLDELRKMLGVEKREWFKDLILYFILPDSELQKVSRNRKSHGLDKLELEGISRDSLLYDCLEELDTEWDLN